MAKRAKSIFCCVFVNTSSSKVFVTNSEGVITDVNFEKLTPEEAGVFIAVQDAFNMAIQKHGSFQYTLQVCPVDYGNNMAVTQQNGLFLLPAALMEATYPDGTRKRYALGKDLDDKLFGSNWKPESVYPYVSILLLNTPVGQEQSNDSLLCRLFPALCNVGGWVWLGLAMGASYKTTQARNVGKAIWGGASILLWKEYLDRGGLDQIKEVVGIGKIKDNERGKPGGRVDWYWGNLMPQPRVVGVEAVSGKQFIDPTEVVKHFRVHSVEFGNWVNQQERINFLYGGTVTMRDMARVLNIPQSRMGLKGKLALAFGARGQGGRAAAFYQGGFKVINLTKKAGKGAFVHEWGHAVDDALGWPSDHRSTRKQPDYSGKRSGTASYLVETVLDKILWNSDGSPSSYQKFLKGQGEYLNRRAEIWARIVEAFYWKRFKALGIYNTFGVPYSYQGDWPEQKLMDRVMNPVAQILRKI